MILRRVIQHVKEQNWTAIAIDFVIVVIGVFVGIQVSNWNAERGDRAAEAQYLVAMKEDVDYSIGKLEDLLRQLEQQQASRKALFEYATGPDAAIAPADRDRMVLHGLFQLPMIDISDVTFETLKSSGRLALVRSPVLVSELQSLSAKVAGALRSQADEIQVTYLFSDPLLVEHVDMAGVFRHPNLNGRTSVPWLGEAPADPVAPQVMKSRRFANVLLYRTFFTDARLDNARGMLEQHRRIAKLIQARQDELGAGR